MFKNFQVLYEPSFAGLWTTVKYSSGDCGDGLFAGTVQTGLVRRKSK